MTSHGPRNADRGRHGARQQQFRAHEASPPVVRADPARLLASVNQCRTESTSVIRPRYCNVMDPDRFHLGGIVLALLERYCNANPALLPHSVAWLLPHSVAWRARGKSQLWCQVQCVSTPRTCDEKAATTSEFGPARPNRWIRRFPFFNCTSIARASEWPAQAPSPELRSCVSAEWPRVPKR